MIVKLQIVLLLIFFLSSCITKFVPLLSEEKELLVVQGLVTDQHQPDTIKLSMSKPVGQVGEPTPVTGSIVEISDNIGNRHSLKEIKKGTYITDVTDFRGIPGRIYTLHITTNMGNSKLNYESIPMEMKAVPQIDSIYYDKINIKKPSPNYKGVDACQIYLNTYDPENNCKYYRWDYSETWKIRLLYEVPNYLCWISEKSHSINIKSTAAFEEARISRFPVKYISNATDRLKIEYSILVNQYSLNENEYNYWAKVQNVVQDVGSLYDIIPASVPGNIMCIEDPAEKVLGYFSVSAKVSKRIYIADNFEGIIDPYARCITDTVYTNNFPGLNINTWILFSHVCSFPCIPFYEITTRRECSDCTLRGTTIKPDFWIDGKN